MMYGYPILSQQLYAHVDAKLERVEGHIREYFYLACNLKELGDRSTDFDSLYAAWMDVKRCRKDLKYEYLGLKDSWL